MTTGRRRLSVIAGAAVVVVGAAVTIPFLLKSPAGPARPQLSASPPPAATSPLRPTRIPLPASLTGSAISSLAFSPSGSMLALAGASGTCLMGVATHNCTSVAARAVSVAFSPDGTILAT